MDEKNGKNNDFIGYEYRDFTITYELESLWADSMECFGWQLEGRHISSLQGTNKVNLKFKRNRKIINKAELTRLQRQFEASVKNIENLEKSKTNTASAVAFTLGIIGCAFMAGSVFSFEAGRIPLTIILAIPGFLGWILPYFCYVKLRNKKTASLTPLIEQEYDKVYETCEKASKLLL